MIEVLAITYLFSFNQSDKFFFNCTYVEPETSFPKKIIIMMCTLIKKTLNFIIRLYVWWYIKKCALKYNFNEKVS